MTAKEYLRQYCEAENDITDKLEEISRLRALAEKTTQAFGGDRVRTSGEDRLPKIIAKIADMEADVDKEIDELQSKKEDVQKIINLVPDKKQRKVLERRYIKGEKWEQIAVNLNYDYRWVTRLHGRALITVSELIVKYAPKSPYNL